MLALALPLLAAVDVLYAAEVTTKSIRRIDATTGALLGHALAPGQLASECFALGNDGLLYVYDPAGIAIRRVDPLTGAQVGAFTLAPGVAPTSLAISGSGLLFVANAAGMFAFDAASGAFVANGAPYPYSRVVRAPTGDVFACGDDEWGAYIDRFDGATGALVTTTHWIPHWPSGGRYRDLAFQASGDLVAVFVPWSGSAYIEDCPPPVFALCATGTPALTIGLQAALAANTDGSAFLFGKQQGTFGIQQLATPSAAQLAWLPLSGVVDLEFERPFDCNGNGTVDAADIASGTSGDCNGNGRPDECDLAFGSSLDLDANLVPDECALLTSNVATASIAAQGAQSLALSAGSVHAGRAYLLLGSTTGTAPPLAIDGLALPLALDAYFAFTLANPNKPPLSSSFGVLDAAGAAQATVQVPPGTSAALAGLHLWHASVVIALAPTPHAAATSNAVGLTLVP
ncbi:MAG: hypothetical protein EPO68_03335 [Planctomycetota bacterium]|nr:MAG: hypothetical protein EPO68_03335 [Planctomycetota bacterium]